MFKLSLYSFSVLAMLMLPACASSAKVWQPSPGTSWQWQLKGDVDTSVDVEMFDIDLFDVPTSVINALHAKNRIVICYFSAGSHEDWRPDAGVFPGTVKGAPLDGWPGERWLDIRNQAVLFPIMRTRLDLAVAKGCDGVEPDNVDAYQNKSGFPLTEKDQVAYNIWLAKEAHARGLSIGLKNDLAQIPELVGHFDWVLNEQCFQFKECAALGPFVKAKKAVFGVEYEGKASDFCRKANALNFDWLLKKLDLGPERLSCR